MSRRRRHATWHDGPFPLLLAHRGASAALPENTLGAFALAAEQGADGIELDVHLSADGVPIVIHDADLARTTDGSGPVAELTAAEIQMFDAGDGDKVPTLDDVFQAFGPRFLYNVEIKSGGWRDSGVEAAVADLIASYSLETRVVVSSFNAASVRRARQYMTRSVGLGWLHYVAWKKWTVAVLPATSVHPHFSLVDAAYMAWARERNLQVNVWTVDDPAEFDRLAALGVHAIITNDPTAVGNGG